ncbi:MAG TPA: acetyl-CoA carboxylase biotin carboxyl carrier protein [Aestuariivirgaceae bacterium]|jgi:acetyl-CoA carboxylase biotin carboxyl carrier protein
MSKPKKPSRGKSESGVDLSEFEGPELGATAELIRELANLLRETGLGELEIQDKNIRVRLARGLQQAKGAPLALDSDAAPLQQMPRNDGQRESETDDTLDLSSHPGAVKSPMVGTAYLAPAPGAANFVEVGKEVKQGQTIIIIEAMKTMNQIQAPRSGRVTHVFVENGQPVEYGEPLLIIE